MSAQACLRLKKVQKDDIVALFENHLQEMAALQQDCLDVAYKLQVGCCVCLCKQQHVSIGLCGLEACG